MSQPLSVYQLHAALEQAIADGHGTRPVQVLELVNGVPLLRPVLFAADAQPYDGAHFLIHPADDARPPAWLGGNHG